MDIIIEFHYSQNNSNSFQTRVICYDNFKEFKKRIKDGKCFGVKGTLLGNSLP